MEAGSINLRERAVVLRLAGFSEMLIRLQLILVQLSDFESAEFSHN